MDLRNDWIKVETTVVRKYTFPCQDCGQELIIIQTGSELCKTDLQFIVNFCHVEKQLDGLFHYLPDRKKQINVQIERNQPCTKQTELST